MPQETFSSSLFRPRSDRAGFKPGSLTTRCHVDHPGLEANIQISVATLAIHSSCCLHAYKYNVHPWQFFDLWHTLDKHVVANQNESDLDFPRLSIGLHTCRIVGARWMIQVVRYCP